MEHGLETVEPFFTLIEAAKNLTRLRSLSACVRRWLDEVESRGNAPARTRGMPCLRAMRGGPREIEH